jgi:hypothetical protein
MLSPQPLLAHLAELEGDMSRLEIGRRQSFFFTNFGYAHKRQLDEQPLI